MNQFEPAVLTAPDGVVHVEPVFRLEVAADTRYLEMIASLIEAFCFASGLEEDDSRAMQVAVDEICTNTVLHGYSSDPTNKFLVEGYRCDERVCIAVTEWGKPFDLLTVPDPDVESPLEERPLGGLGIYLARKLADKFEYVCSDEGAKTFRLEKTLITNMS